MLLDPLQGAPGAVRGLQDRLMPLHCGWLNVLKVSQRNCKVECSPLNQGSSIFLVSPISQLLRPGPVIGLFPRKPNIPGSLSARSCGTVIWPMVEGSNQ